MCGGEVFAKQLKKRLICKDCRKIINRKCDRDYRKKTHNASTHRYEKTVSGFLMRKYRNMESRVKGIQYLKSHLYKGLSLLSRKEFYDWALNSSDFKTLFTEWVKNGFDRKLCPTVDRINSAEGYELSNMRWITHSENSRLGNLSRYNKLKI